MVFDFVPEAVDLDGGVVFAVNDVVEGDEAAGSDEWAVHVEVLFDAFVGVVTVDEGEVEGLVEFVFDFIERVGLV